MNNNLGEIFYNGKIINLSSTDENDLFNMYNELENNQIIKKEQIKNILREMEGV